jgi:hypothetical protein
MATAGDPLGMVKRLSLTTFDTSTSRYLVQQYGDYTSLHNTASMKSPIQPPHTVMLSYFLVQVIFEKLLIIHVFKKFLNCMEIEALLACSKIPTSIPIVNQLNPHIQFHTSIPRSPKLFFPKFSCEQDLIYGKILHSPGDYEKYCLLGCESV